MQKLPRTLIFVVVAISMVMTAFLPASSAPAPAALEYPRAETLYTSGTQWGPPSSWNPLNTGGYAMGTIGLCYETLFIYDPLADKFTPFLAESATWTDATTYEVKIRQGIKWTNGSPLTADDVKFTFDIADPNGTTKAGLAYSGLWKFLNSVDKKDANTVVFKFKSDPAYQEVGYYFFATAILPKALWEKRDVKEITGGANKPPVGTGPYKYETSDQDRMVWIRNDAWWGKDVFGKLPAPKRIVDIVNGSNNVALGKMLQGGLDLSNNFLPGVASLVNSGYSVKTYYKDAPYMLSANVAAMLINEQKKPMDDVKFRQALAWMINVNDIVEKDYTGIVKAADPTGLLPIWDKYIDKDQVKELGWSYDPEKAKKILADAGYKDVDGDKFLEAPDGSKIALKVTCPSGWTDWMAAIQIISRDAKAIGLNIEPDYPDYGPWRDAQLKGTFDLTLQNEAQMSSTVWSYYKWVFQNPISNVATAQYGNYGRYDNKEAFDLVDQLDKVKVGDDAAIKEIATKLQKITMTEMPTVPLWYNGLWSQTSDTVWTNWPSAEGTNHYLPATWRGYWNLSGIQMLLELKPVEKK
jgi:peptide/nickel transport system substrate-binding protein